MGNAIKKGFLVVVPQFVFSLLPPPAYSLFGLFLAMNMGAGISPWGVTVQTPNHHSPGDFSLGISSIFPAPLSASKGLQRGGDPINNPFSCYWIKKFRLLRICYKK